MKIYEITTNQFDYMDILLIGDEEEKMVNKYLKESTIFALHEGKILVSVCAVVETNSDTVEIKNLATYPEYRNKGYATELIDFVCDKYKNDFKYVVLGTGENEKTLNFYKKRGFVETYRIKNFFVDNYSHPIIENGKQLKDMIYLKKSITGYSKI